MIEGLERVLEGSGQRGVTELRGSRNCSAAVTAEPADSAWPKR